MRHDIDFPGRQPDEQIMMVLHRHWFIFLRHIILLFLLAGAPLVVGYIWSQIVNFSWDSTSLSYVLVIMAAALYYLFLWILIFGYWLDYYLDVFIVTNKRIVDIEQAGLFGRTVAEERLYRIQDVTSDSQGMLATSFHYGNVYVQTAGKTERFIFENVPNPERISRTILELTDKIVDRLEAHDEHDHHDPAPHQPPSTLRK